MRIVAINIEDLREYVYYSLVEDVEIINFFDKTVPIETTMDAVDSICEKIKRCYADADMFGVELDSEKMGFFVCQDNLLISFGVSPKYRNKEMLSAFWGFIKKVLPDNFQCVLYSHNERALNFLKKGGMKILFDTVTILTNN